MDSPKQNNASSLFLVRMWTDETTDGGQRWSGKVQHVITGESKQFHSWPEMLSIMQGMLPQIDTNDEPSHKSEAQTVGTQSNPLMKLFSRQQNASA